MIKKSLAPSDLKYMLDITLLLCCPSKNVLKEEGGRYLEPTASALLMYY